MKIAFMIPTRDGVMSHACTSSIMKAQNYCESEGHIGNTLWVTGCSVIPIARSLLIAQALEWGAEILIFVDDDVSFFPQQLHMMVDSDMPFITGGYAMRPQQQHFKRLVLTVADENNNPPVRGRYTVVDKAGFGFMKVTRKALEEYIEKYDLKKLYSDGFTFAQNSYYYEYFPYDYEPAKGTGRNKFVTADQAFVRRMKKIGFPCFFHSNLIVPHHQGPIAWLPREEDWEPLNV